jgi:hypothetical protein
MVLIFEAATDQAANTQIDKAGIDALIADPGDGLIADYVLGANYEGVWLTPAILEITVLDATGGTLPTNGPTIVLNPNVLNSADNTPIASIGGALWGNWGASDEDIDIIADIDHNGPPDALDGYLGMSSPGLIIPYNNDDDDRNDTLAWIIHASGKERHISIPHIEFG